MKSILEGSIVICITLFAMELVGRLSTKNGMVYFVRSLVVTALLASMVSSFFSVDFNWDFSSGADTVHQEELSSYVEGEYIQAAREEAKRYLKGLLAAAGLEAEKIETCVDINENNGIVLTKVGLLFTYDSDARRAETLLNSVLGQETEIEVEINGT